MWRQVDVTYHTRLHIHACWAISTCFFHCAYRSKDYEVSIPDNFMCNPILSTKAQTFFRLIDSDQKVLPYTRENTWGKSNCLEDLKTKSKKNNLWSEKLFEKNFAYPKVTMQGRQQVFRKKAVKSWRFIYFHIKCSFFFAFLVLSSYISSDGLVNSYSQNIHARR